MDVITMIGAKRARGSARFLGAAAVAIAAVLLSPPAPPASAEPCPDVEVVFARGTDEPPGVGGTGEAFVDALRSRTGDKSVAVYPVDYAASSDFSSGIEFARTFVDGIRDAGGHLQSTAANCPNTRMVLGGFSQGAALAGFVTSAEIPKEVPQEFVQYLPQPLPPEVADHVAAVTLFGTPSDQFMTDNGVPPVRIGPAYASKTLQLCAPGDSICSGDFDGGPLVAHAMYAMNGMTDQAADFAVAHL